MKSEDHLFCTIKKRQDFLKVSKNGKRFYSEHFLLQILQNPENSGMFRVGYVATRKMGNAVKRNKAKRRLRSLVYLLRDHISKGYDYVFVAKASLWSVTFETLPYDFDDLLKKVTHSIKASDQSYIDRNNTSISNDD